MTIRPARREDAPLVADLLAELGYAASAEAVESRLATLGADDLVLLGDDGAGMIALHRVPRLAEGGALARVTALVVHGDARGRGIGRALLGAAEDAARRWGCGLVEVSCGRRPERAAAHRLYAAAGFADTSTRSVRYWKSVGGGPAGD
jgi:GNAT superfamily N-acetyltransferase